MLTTPALALVSINSDDDGETCSITIEPTTEGYNVEILWWPGEVDPLIGHLADDGIHAEPDANDERGVTFTIAKPMSELITQLNTVVGALTAGERSLDCPVYRYPVFDQFGLGPVLVIVADEWEDSNILLAISEESPLFAIDRWRAYSQQVVDESHKAGSELLKAGLEIWEIYETGFTVTIRGDADALEAMLNIAKCYSPHA